MSFFWRLWGSCLERLAIFFKFLYIAIDKKAYKAQLLYRKNLVQEDIEAITGSVNDFMHDPKELADRIIPQKEEYKEIAEIYLILKQVSSIYEAHSQVLPLQVFNEMRSALDHFFRSLVSIENDADSRVQLGRMKGHIFRAVLDTIKLCCDHYDKTIKSKHKIFSKKALGLVNNGEYIKEVTRLHETAYSLYEDARSKDLSINGQRTDHDVINAYVMAMLAHKDAYKYQAKHYSLITWAKYKASGAFSLGLFTSLSISLAAACIYGLITGEFPTEPAKDLMSYFQESYTSFLASEE